MTYSTLLNAVKSAAGLRLRLKLQPLYGEGGTIFPCTVAGGKYLLSPRRVPGHAENLPCVIIDSVQSQANRLEDALLEDIHAKRIFLPHVETAFPEDQLQKSVGRGGKLTCFDAPHRIFDAILRDSVDDAGKHFPLTPVGEAVIKASSQNATALFDVSPASLLFGSWDSTGISGGLGEKYSRCVVSELVGINAVEGVRAGTRVDPLNAASEVFTSVDAEAKDAIWQDLKKRASAKKKTITKSSEINHGSIIFPKKGENLHGGVTVDYVQQATTISLAALRQLRFPVKGKDTAETSAAAQAVLAAIALHGAALNTERGWFLRSRCDLTLADGESVAWEVLGLDGTAKQTLNSDATRKLLQEAIAAAKQAGLPWRDEPIRLTPSAALLKLVIASQKAHRESTGEETAA